MSTFDKRLHYPSYMKHW